MITGGEVAHEDFSAKYYQKDPEEANPETRNPEPYRDISLIRNTHPPRIPLGL